MKFNAYLAIIAMAALCASCVKEPVAGDGVGAELGVVLGDPLRRGRDVRDREQPELPDGERR